MGSSLCANTQFTIHHDNIIIILSFNKKINYLGIKDRMVF
jgi:hypothetical protein